MLTLLRYMRYARRRVVAAYRRRTFMLRARSDDITRYCATLACAE